MASHTLAPFPPELLAAKKQIREQARAYGLDFFPVIFEMCDYEQMSQIAAYGGFPQRYPHWRFGMEYEQLRKQHHYGLGRIYEMVINNDPCYAYLQESNPLVDQKLVIAHVYGHCDFFKNNLWFSRTNRKMMDEMANHSTHVRKHVERHGADVVERWLDVCLSVEHLIDPHSMFLNRGPLDEKAAPPPREDPVEKYRAKDYMDRYINPPQRLADEAKKRGEDKAKLRHATPVRPTRDVLQYLLDHALLEDWQADCLSIIREESYYYAPQAMTKVMNEGWACLAADSLAFTDRGLITMRDLVESGANSTVFDGDSPQQVYDRNVIRDHKTVTVTTRRGLRISGSDNHRVMLADGTWCRLDELAIGSKVRVAGGGGLWPTKLVSLDWFPKGEPPARAMPAGVVVVQVAELQRVAAAVHLPSLGTDTIRWPRPVPLSPTGDEPLRVSGKLDRRLAAFVGYLACDGRVSRTTSAVVFRTNDPQVASVIGLLSDELFGLSTSETTTPAGTAVTIHSASLVDFLTAAFPNIGTSRDVPAEVLASPKEVVASFLQACFDCDGYPDKQGVCLVTSDEAFGRTVQLLLLNFGILSRRSGKQLRLAGTSAHTFASEINFGLSLKREELRDRLVARGRPKAEAWDDVVVGVETGRADVYDISVAETHRYAAQGFVNHNSYWHSKLMTTHFLDASEVIDYADHHSGTVHMPPGNFNPYKIGLELFRDIEDRWNKGKFGKAYEEADQLGERRRWDTGLGQGREKIFEVRRVYNDVNFIDEFLTPEFIEKHKFYQYGRDPHTGQMRILSRDPKRIKQTMLYRLTNMGQPFVYVVDGNYANRGELYLAQKHNGLDMEIKYAVETLRNLYRIWQRPVHLQARIDDDMMLFSFNGDQAKQQAIHDELPKPAHQVG